MMMPTVQWYMRQKFPDVCQMTTDELNKHLTSVPTNNDIGLKLTDETINFPRNIVVIDSRRQDEFDVSHIPNSKLVHFPTDQETLLNFLTEESRKHETSSAKNSDKKNLEIVCYCSLGYRSSILAQRMATVVKTDIFLSRKDIKLYNLEGSIFKWANENKHMIDLNEKTTKFAHPFSYTFCAFLQKANWKWTPDIKEKI